MNAYLSFLFASLSMQLDPPVQPTPSIADRPPEVSRMQALPQAIASFGAAVLDGETYVLGGHVGRKHEHSSANLSTGFLRLGRAESGDEIACLPGGVGLQGLALVECDGALIRIGGLSARNEPGEDEDLHSVDACAAYDPRSRAWTELPALPEPRSSHDACTWNGRIYVVGGWTVAGKPDQAEWSTTTCVLDTRAEQPRWTPIEQPFRRRALSVAVTTHAIWAIGGLDEDEQPSAAVDVLDVDRGVWRSGPSLPEHGFGASAAVVDERVYVSTSSGVVWRTTVTGDSWERVGELAIPRMFHRVLATAGGELVVIGGATSGGHTTNIEWFDPDAGEAACRARSLDLHFVPQARQRQGFALHGDELFVLGGNQRTGQRAFEPGDFLDECYSVELLTGAVRPCAPLPGPRQSMETLSLVRPASAILACGGYGHDGTSERSFDDVWKLELATRTWDRTEAVLPSARTGFGLAAIGGRIHVFGGMDHEPGRDPVSAHRDEISVAPLAWPLQPFEDFDVRLPEPRRAFGGAVHESEYFVVGGLTEGFEPVESCAVFDSKTGGWNTIASPSHHRIAPSLVVWRGTLILFGGSSRGDDGRFHPDPSVEAFDLRTRSWSTWIESLPFPSDGAVLLAWRDRLIAFRVDHETGRSEVWFLTGDPLRGSRARG